jgi:chloramphenicol 3-O-phosphotransferase
VIFINGVQSAGKSTVAKLVERRTSTFHIVSSDELIREVPVHQRVSRAAELFGRLLTTADEQQEANNVIVDAALTERQIREAKECFTDKTLFVLLRVTESDRVRRERSRRDRRLANTFRKEWHEIVGSDALYDLVLDSSALNPAQCASRVIRTAQHAWGEVEL